MPVKSKANRAEKAAEGVIVVSAQQSRFHTEAIDPQNLKEIDIKDLTISIGGLEILDHAHLKIQNGVHYVFHARNGLGVCSTRSFAIRRTDQS
jgi:ATP-binding cassette, subfamily F, member 3